MAALDVRVACPFCGGAIHPVAGRCKHCKEDLNPTRAARPPAQAPLPALNGNALGHVPQATIAATYINPMPALPALPALPAAMPAMATGPARDVAILPPRPTGRSVAVTTHSPLRSWPVVVIGLAAVAIVAAVAIMIWPAGKPERANRDQPQRELAPPPAPERMDTDPQPQVAPQHSQIDPPAPRQTPDPLPPPSAPHNIDPQDPFASSSGGLSGLSLKGMAGADMMMAVMGHACARLKACPDADESVRDMCDMFSQYSRAAKPPDCDAAKQCLEMIDKLDCTAAATPQSLMTTIPSCLKAETSC